MSVSRVGCIHVLMSHSMQEFGEDIDNEGSWEFDTVRARPSLDATRGDDFLIPDTDQEEATTLSTVRPPATESPIYASHAFRRRQPTSFRPFQDSWNGLPVVDSEPSAISDAPASRLVSSEREGSVKK